jgi:hypothetical protein
MSKFLKSFALDHDQGIWLVIAENLLDCLGNLGTTEAMVRYNEKMSMIFDCFFGNSPDPTWMTTVSVKAKRLTFAIQQVSPLILQG